MDMTMSSTKPSWVYVVTSFQRRRRWTPEQKLEIIIRTNEPRSSVRKLPQNENNMKIEASISLRRRDEEVKVHGEPDCCNLG